MLLLSRKSILLVLLITFGLSCSRNPVTGKKELNLMSEQQEIAMGQQSDPAIQAMYGVYEDAKLQRFINEKGQAMARQSHRPGLDYEFKIMDSPVVNAFAVPGGYVYFTRGIMAHFNNEAEFAGVLGHEIGHITARHSSRQYTTQLIGQVALIGGMIVSPEFAQFGEAAMQGLSLMLMKYSRDHESESDKLGVEYSTKIGYDAHEMGDFFNTLKRLSEQSGGDQLPTFMSTHPDPSDRYNRVHKLATEAQSKDSRSNYNVGRDSYLDMIDGLVYGEDPRQGYVERGVFYHPDLKFQFKTPNGWQLANTPSQVQMGNKDGNAAIIFSLSSASTLPDAVSQAIKNNGLTLRNQNNTKVNGLPAIVTVSSQSMQDNSGQTVTLMVKSYFIQYEGKIYVFNGLTYEQLYSQFQTIFDQTMTSFSTLRDASKLNRTADRIKIVQLSQAMTLQQALSHYKMPSSRFEELAILNGMQLSDRLSSGTKIKVLTLGQGSSNK